MAPLTIPFNDVHIQFQDLEYVHFWFDPDNHDSQNYLLEQIVDEETLKDPGSNSIAYFMASDKNTLKIAKGSSVLTDPILISTDGDEAYATILSIPLSILDSRPYEAISYDIEKQEIHLAPIAGNTYQNFTLPRKIIDMAQIIVSEEEITQEITQKIVPQKHVAVDEKKSWFRLAHGPHALLPVSVEPDKTIYLGPENEGSSDDFTENITDFKFPFILFTHPRTLAFQGYLNDSNAEKSINAKAFGNESVIEIDLAQTDMIVEPNALIGWTGDPYIGRQMFKDPRLVILGENYFYHYYYHCYYHHCYYHHRYHMK